MSQDLSPKGPSNQSFDPYRIWTEKGANYRAPFSEVQKAFSDWLRETLRWLWDGHTIVKSIWHLARQDGLVAWAKYESFNRLKIAGREAFTLADFMQLHFNEEARQHGKKASQDPFWTPLFIAKQLAGDIGFFSHIELVFNQKGFVHQSNQRLLCIWHDRNFVPTEFWTASAISDYMRIVLEASGASGDSAPNALLIRQWMSRIGIHLKPPAIVSGFNAKGITDFDQDAAKIHGLPAIGDFPNWPFFL
jgi:hypothetical protein